MMNGKGVTGLAGVVVRVVLAGMFSALIAGCSGPSANEKWMQFVTDSVGKQYQSFADESAAMVDASKSFCAGPDKTKATLAPIQQQWLKTMASWQQVQWVRFGPVVKNNEDWRIQFWPDKKNLVSRKTQQLLEKEEPITDQVVEKASVVVQGVSELELLIFDPDYTPAYSANNAVAERQCQLLVAVSTRLHKTSSDIASNWKDPALNTDWLKTSAELDEEQLAQLRNGKVIDSLLGQMERVKTDKIGGPLGYKNRSKRANGYFAESWRSGSSMANIKNNLVSLQNLLKQPGQYALADYLSDRSQAALADRLMQDLDGLLRQIDTIEPALKDAVVDMGSKAEVEKIYDQLGELNQVLRQQLAPALGVALGFNSNDGD